MGKKNQGLLITWLTPVCTGAENFCTCLADTYYWLLWDRPQGWRGIWAAWRGHPYSLKSLIWMKQICVLQWGWFQRANLKLTYGSVILSRNTTLQLQNSFWNLLIYSQHYLMRRTIKKEHFVLKSPNQLLCYPNQNSTLFWGFPSRTTKDIGTFYRLRHQ